MARQYHKPIKSGGVSRCIYCGEEKQRVPRDRKNPHQTNLPRTIHDGCPKSPTGKHVFATEPVEYGWSSKEFPK